MDTSSNKLYNKNLDLSNNKDKVSIIKRIVHKLTNVLHTIIKEYSVENKTTTTPVNTSNIKYKCLELKATSISLSDYIERLVKNNDYSLTNLLCSFILIDRLINNNKDFIITNKNIYKVVFSCFILSTKLNNDSIYHDTDYAYLGGFSLKTYNKINNTILELLNFDIFISFEDFEYYFNYIF